MLLHSIREKATGWFAWVIVILISIPFALWGINSYITPDSNPAVAHVGDYKITVSEFQNAVQNESQKLQGQVDNTLIKQLVLEKLINNRALINYLTAKGFTISKAQIDAYIRNDPTFQLDGKFSTDRYNRYLPSAYSKSNYRSNIATQLLLAQFSKGVTSSSIVSDQEVKRVIQLIKQKRDISYAVIKADTFKDSVQISDEEIKDYYQNFKNQFQNPEQIKLAYLELSRADIAKNIPVTEEQIEKYYHDNLAKFTEPERRKASHILFTLATDADDETKAAVKKQAQTVLDKINKGADFAEMAKKYSKDPGSADKGGDLGFFGAGEMVPAFEKAASALKPGEVSGLVESPFGFHIIKLTEVQGGQSKPLEKVKDQIIADIQFEKAENDYFEKTELMQTLAFEQPDSLEPVATELNLNLAESGLISKRGGKGIFANPKLLSAAFSETVLEEGNNSDLIELGDDHVALIHLIERIPANIKPLEEVKDVIKSRLQKQQISSKAQEQGVKIIKELNAGKTMEDIAQANNLTLKTPGLVDRQAVNLPAAILTKAFTMPRDVKYAETTMITGDVAIVAVDTIKDGDTNDKALFKDIKNALLQNKGNLETALAILQVRSESDIKINTKSLTQDNL